MKKFKNIALKTKQSQGFTIIEVSLFLALTGVVMLGALGIFSNIKQQRYNDSVQNFAEYLRGIYSQVENVENSGTNCGCTTGTSNTCCGQTKTAIYGKVVIVSGDDISSYTVLGGAHVSSKLFEFKSALGSSGANITFDTSSKLSYSPLWQASVKLKEKDSDNFNGSILIARSPNSGVIHTYFSKDIAASNGLSDWLNGANVQDVNFCVYSEDDGGYPRNVRITRDAHNASGVQLIGT